jgi:hypothetical protein
MVGHSVANADDTSLDDLLHSDLPLGEMRQRVIARITAFERNFRRRFPLLWISTMLGPLAASGALLVTIGLVFGWGLAQRYFWAAVLTFFVFGRFVILGGVDEDATGWMARYGLSPGQLFGMVTWMDFAVALFVTFHMGFLFRIPWLGPKIAGLTSDSRFIMDQQPWIRRVAFGALVAFVVFPTSTTGSIGGSIFGRLLGLGRLRTLLGVFAGSLIGNGLMFLFAREFNELNTGPYGTLLKVSGICFMIAGVLWIEWRYRKAKRKYLESHMSRAADRPAGPGT